MSTTETGIHDMAQAGTGNVDLNLEAIVIPVSDVERDENWPDWYAAYMVAEQPGSELPT